MDRLIKRMMHMLVAILFVVLAESVATHAVGPVINANVYDGKPPVLTITSHQSGAVVSQRSMRFTGTIRNINQLMIYIDGAYSQTVAVDTGSSSYDFLLALPEGTHTIKLVGLDAFTGTTIEDSIVLTYSPTATPSVSEVVTGTTSATKKAVVDSSAYIQDQVDQASVSEPAAFLSDVGYEIMDALDLVPTTSQQSMPQMLSRFGVIVTGVALIILTNPMINLYHLIRYHLLKWKIHALPALVRHHAAFALRAGGALLLVVGFLV